MPVLGVFRIIRWALALVGVVALVLCGMLATPVKSLPPLASIHAGARAIGREGKPELSRFQARDGTWLAYRRTLVPATHRDRLAAIPTGDRFRQCA
jgi:hypothetical protein